MKKLIAIVITLIFIFDGTGYCLRVPQGDLHRVLDSLNNVSTAQPQPFRFPNYIWKIFKAKLEALEPEFPGITEIISRSGLSWTEYTGEIQRIDDALREKYGKEKGREYLGYKAVNGVWEAAKDAVNEANVYQKGDPRYLESGWQVRVVIGHHEDIHALLKTEIFKDLIADFRRNLERAFNSSLTGNHAFIRAIKRMYGDPHASEVSDKVNWYIEEFLTVCIQEDLLFNKDARKMFQRLGVENNKAIEITQRTINDVKKKAKIEDFQKERDRFVVAVMLLEHGGPLDLKNFLTSGIRTALDPFCYEKNIIINDTVRERIKELVSRAQKLGNDYARLYSPANEMCYKVHDQRQDLPGFEQNYKDFLKELETFFTAFTTLFENKLSDYKNMEWFMKNSEYKEHIANILTQIEESMMQNISALQSFLTPEIGIRKEPIPLASWLNRIYRTKVTGVPAAISDVPIIVKGNAQPEIEANPELLHLAIERIISNGFHEITKTGDITKDKVKIELDSRDGNAFITIVSPGHISQEYLKINPRTGLPNILSLNYLRPGVNHGIALSFVTEAIMKMGGKIEVRNRIDPKSPKVEFILTFPAKDLQPSVQPASSHNVRSMESWMRYKLELLQKDVDAWVREEVSLGNIQQYILGRLNSLMNKDPVILQQILNRQPGIHIFKFLRNQPLGNTFERELTRRVSGIHTQTEQRKIINPMRRLKRSKANERSL